MKYPNRALHRVLRVCVFPDKLRHRTSALILIAVAKTHTLDETVPDDASYTEDADRVVPPDCCYFCRTRGGNAAYECFKEEGEDRCTRCIRDNKKNEEVAAIEARCPQCTRRGFKTCDGGDPCDTCKRNKTGHLRHKQPEKKVKRDNPPAPSGTRASRRNKVFEPGQNVPLKQSTIAHDADASLATGVEGLATAPCTPIPQADSDLDVLCNDEDMVITETPKPNAKPRVHRLHLSTNGRADLFPEFRMPGSFSMMLQIKT
jgi:hypothetical protein